MTDLAESTAALHDEQRRLRQLRTVVDLTCNVIAQGRLTRPEAFELVEAARHRILELFPDKEGTYDLVLAPRFVRLIEENCPPAARVLAFASRPSDRDRSARS